MNRGASFTSLPMMLNVWRITLHCRWKIGWSGTREKHMMAGTFSKVERKMASAFTSTSTNNATFTRYVLNNVEPFHGGQKI
jgi:hypothetical protein